MQQTVRTAMMAPLGIIWLLGGPITYLLLLIDTWQGHGSVFIKILITVTLDAFLAMIWPITWVIWTVTHLGGGATPLRLFF